MSELKDIKDMLEGIQKAVHNNSVRTERIDRMLVGDERYNQRGLIHAVQEAIDKGDNLREAYDSHIQKIKLKEAKQKGMVLGIGMAGGGFGAWLKSLLGF